MNPYLFNFYPQPRFTVVLPAAQFAANIRFLSTGHAGATPWGYPQTVGRVDIDGQCGLETGREEQYSISGSFRHDATFLHVSLPVNIEECG